MASKLVFIGGALKVPPAIQDAFQMLSHVGLKIQHLKFGLSDRKADKFVS